MGKFNLRSPPHITFNQQANSSGLVESLLKDLAKRKRQQRSAEAKALEATIATWNDFGDKVASFADEHMTF